MRRCVGCYESKPKRELLRIVRTTEGIIVSDIKDGNQIIEKIEERLIGRYPLETIIDPTTKEAYAFYKEYRKEY